MSPYEPGSDVVVVTRRPKGGAARSTYRTFGETLRGLKTTLGRYAEGVTTIHAVTAVDVATTPTTVTVT